MALEVNIDPIAPIQKGNLVTFEIRFVDALGDVINVSPATSSRIKFEDPDADNSSEAGAFKTDGSDGIIVATFTPTKSGRWRLQGEVTIGGQPKNSGKGTFLVATNLP